MFYIGVIPFGSFDMQQPSNHRSNRLNVILKDPSSWKLYAKFKKKVGHSGEGGALLFF